MIAAPLLGDKSLLLISLVRVNRSETHRSIDKMDQANRCLGDHDGRGDDEDQTEDAESNH